MTSKLAALVGSLLCLFSSLRAQSPCSETVLVNVQDKTGKFISSLQSSDFTVEVQSRHVEVASAAAGKGIRRAVLAIDVSGSMTSNQRIGKAVYELLRSFPESSQLALVLFSQKILKVIPFGHSRQEMMDAVAALPPFTGQTALRDSLTYAHSMLRPSEPGDMVVVLTDGGDDKSKISASKLKEDYLRSRVRLGVILFEDSFFRTEEESWGAEDLGNFVDQVGGALLTLHNPYEVGGVRDFLRQLEEYYAIQIATTPTHKPVHLQIDLRDSAGKKKRDLIVRYPHESLATCPTGSQSRSSSER